MNKLSLLLLLLSLVLISCNKQINNSNNLATKDGEGILYSQDLLRYFNFKEKYETSGFTFLYECRKNFLEKSILKKDLNPCPLIVNKDLNDLVFMVGNSSYDSIIKAELLEEGWLNDSISYLIFTSENKNSNGHLAGNHDFMKILVVRSGNNLKSISKIYSRWTDSFHSYENSILKLDEKLYQMNDYIYEFPCGNILSSYTLFNINGNGFIEILDEKSALPYRQRVFDNLNNLNLK